MGNILTKCLIVQGTGWQTLPVVGALQRKQGTLSQNEKDYSFESNRAKEGMRILAAAPEECRSPPCSEPFNPFHPNPKERHSNTS